MGKNKNRNQNQIQKPPHSNATQEENLDHLSQTSEDASDELDDEEEVETPPRPRVPELTSVVRHCGIPVQVYDHAKKVFCHGCHEWAQVDKCEVEKKL